MNGKKRPFCNKSEMKSNIIKLFINGNFIIYTQ